jgi:hypothetical protein
MKMPCLFIGFLIPIVSLFAQMPNVKFGEVTNSDFENNIYSIDSNAHAIVLYDACKAKYYGDNKGGFNIEYTYHRRIRLLNKNAFDQLATINIYLYKGSGSFEDKMSKINAATYNFENGLVKKSNVEKSAIFKDKVSKTFQVQKFTFPNLSEGCIIEYTYTIISPFERNLRAHQFQENYPVLWSQYDVTIPALYEYVIIKTGQHPYTIEKTEIEEGQYNIRNSGGSEKDEVYSYKTNDYHTTFAMKNVTAIKKENFTSSLSNHLAKIEFQLSATNYPNEPRKDILRTWYQVADELLKDENFGKLVSEKNGWLDDEIKKIIPQNGTEEQNAKAIYDFVRTQFICTDYNEKYVYTSLKKIFANKKGSVADINILLIAMLKNIEIDADPVLLSTTENGKAPSIYPILNKYNYVIARALINNQSVLLDASHPKIGYGKLDINCYNGAARIISEQPMILSLDSDSIKESKTTNFVFIKDPKNPKNLIGRFTSSLGYYESVGIRKNIANSTQEDFFKKIKTNYGSEIKVSNTKIDSLNILEEPVSITYDLEQEFNDEDIIYLNPLFLEKTKENLFAAADRKYPVEMPFKIAERIVLNMEIPAGYKIEETPKSAIVKLNDGVDGVFEFLVSKKTDKILINCHLELYKSVFQPDEYESLREFFSYVVKKQNEYVVLKKVQ